MSKKAFTLIELLIVVLIIGILSAIAIPMYQGAVDKSHWSTMLPGAKAIKDAEEAFKMSNDGYTDTMGNLDVTMENSDLTFNLITPNNTSDPNVIRVTNSKLANVRLASYLDDNPKFAGQLHCEAATGDERANRLCEKLLLGQYLKNTDDGYTRYLLDQSVDKATCGAATGSWSSSKTKCYNTTIERCTDLGMGVIADENYPDQCGYTNGGGSKIGPEGMCKGAAFRGCSSKEYDNSACAGDGVQACSYSSFKNGASCEASTIDNGYGSTCYGAKLYSGSKCVAKVLNGCNTGWPAAVEYLGGCCEEGVPGQTNCPSNAPKC
ncbi:MAG: pilin [Elusimicrobiaceae bacterium]|nr:pilin [Elusimicrobiaceae bacterium]